MSVENLRRYEFFHNEHCDRNCGMTPQHDGPFVKFEEAVVASSNSLQQLKAEIATLMYELEDDVSGYGTNVKYPYLIERLRQLSAV